MRIEYFGRELLHMYYTHKSPMKLRIRLLLGLHLLSRFEREVDPDGVLDPKERARRAEHAKKAYFLKLALASRKARGGQKANKYQSQARC